ncbi:hypothetical protein C8Q78DRAFT_933185, partial [Trametes maxima]
AFVVKADSRYGPITTIRKNGKIVKKIKWTAFRLEDSDWERVALCVDILMDANRYLEHFSAATMLTIHRVIPALETLCTRWEKKLKKDKYQIFHDALQRGVEKLSKYYMRLDQMMVYILALHKYCSTFYLTVLHPYYKLAYIQAKWGGATEQLREIEAGNEDAINWIERTREVSREAV